MWGLLAAGWTSARPPPASAYQRGINGKRRLHRGGKREGEFISTCFDAENRAATAIGKNFAALGNRGHWTVANETYSFRIPWARGIFRRGLEIRHRPGGLPIGAGIGTRDKENHIARGHIARVGKEQPVHSSRRGCSLALTQRRGDSLSWTTVMYTTLGSPADWCADGGARFRLFSFRFW